jgi:hypothetical protein
MSLKAEQHFQMAAGYENAAADESFPAQTRAAFAKKANWFPLLALEVARRRLRIFLANRAIALGWALKGSCKAGAYRLVATARWLAPEAERFLVLRTSSHNHHRRILRLADLGTLHVQPLRVAAGGLIVLVLLGSLDPAKRATAITSQLKLSEPTRQLAPVSGMQIEIVPLPTRKPQNAYSVLNETGSIPVTQKRVAQQKSARHKRKP